MAKTIKNQSFDKANKLAKMTKLSKVNKMIEKEEFEGLPVRVKL